MKRLRILLATLLLVTICSTTVFAREDIRVVFEEPVVYSAKAGESLPYRVNVLLPDNYISIYKSFAITVLMDKNLQVEKLNVSGADGVKNQIMIDKTTLKDSGQDLCTINVNDVKKLNGIKEFSIEIDGKAKVDASGESFKNSFVVTTTNIDGKENGNQTDISTNDEVKESELIVNDITTNSTTISGKSTPNAKVVVYLNDKVFKEVMVDKNGNFSFNIEKLDANANLVFKSYAKAESVPMVKSITVKTQADSEVSVKNFLKLRDYIDRAKALETKWATQEDARRLLAAIANGQYMEVKTDLAPKELDEGLNRLEGSMKVIRFPFMKGYSENEFGANNKLSRSEAASLFTQLSKDKNTEVTYSSFSDVDQKSWYAESVAYMESRGILKGYNDGTFRPKNPISRAEFAQVISNYADLRNSVKPLEFSDIKSGYWAKDAIDLVTSAGLMQGRGQNKFAPNEPITRGEVATVINSYLNRKPDKYFMDKYSKNPYTDLRSNHWAYYQILEATGN